MKNIEQLRNSLLTNIGDIKSGRLPVKEAEAITNTAGKVLNTVIVQLKYAELRKEEPNIDFLNVN
jgi:hypothetical protein